MRPLSLYIHIPFCIRTCPYCTFYRLPYDKTKENVFVDAAISEFTSSISSFKEKPCLRTIYFGGGSPSTLQLSSIDNIFDVIDPYRIGDKTLEITFELNPEDVTSALLDHLKSKGVNRPSLGIQSMDGTALKTLDRCSLRENERALEQVCTRFKNFNVDLLLGIPDSGSDPLAATLRTLGRYNPTHVSVYCLEGGGDEGDRVRQFLSRVDQDDAAKQYLSTSTALKKEGFIHYEVSNFALPEKESAHNRAYWDGDDYLGIGPGAHSFLSGRRWFNPPSLDLYLTGVERGFDENREEDVMDDKKRGLERMILGLRTDRGIPLGTVGCTPEEIRELEARNLVSIVNDHIILTDRGFLLLDEIAIRFSRKY